MDKPADTQFPILDALANRWSPRAFADTPVEPEKLGSLFDAARWAASAFNEQPWRFIVATKDQPEAPGSAYEKLLGCLVEANQAWAKAAPVLLLTVGRTTFTKNDKDNRVWPHDIGLAMGNLCAQATALGLVVHQMAGIDLDKSRGTYHIPAPFEPFTAAAIGYPGDPATLTEDWMKDAEQAPRSRNAFADFVFSDWETPSSIVST
ncbi:MAG: nitroreductase family protein [Planctomycetota bacterium]